MTGDSYPAEHIDWLNGWLRSRDTGLSSEALAWHGVTGAPLFDALGRVALPHDKWDLGRCERMVASAPAVLQERMIPTLEAWRRHVEERP